MRKISLIIVSLFLILGSAFSDNDRITFDLSELPAVSREFITAHFDQMEISHLKIEKGLLGVKSYDVILVDGTTVEFNRSGEWTEIDGHQTMLPVTVIPQSIYQYVQNHFTGRKIMSIEKEKRGYQVELDNGLDLVFTKSGIFKHVDE